MTSRFSGTRTTPRIGKRRKHDRPGAGSRGVDSGRANTVTTTAPLTREQHAAEHTDHARILRLLGGIVNDPEHISILVVDGQPKSKSRARRGKGGHMFTPNEQRIAEQALGYRLKSVIRSPFAGNLAVACVFFRANHHRVDVDNMLKHVMDSANGICWNDDYQVTAMVGIAEVDAVRPRTVIAIGPHQSTMTRDSIAAERLTCQHCGQAFGIRNRTTTRRFCSRTCASRSRERTSYRKCVDCGKEGRIKPPHASQRCRECWLKSEEPNVRT